MIVNSQKVTAFQVTLILTEEEARRLLVDAGEFQAQLRKILSEYQGEKYMEHLGGNGQAGVKKLAEPSSTHKRGSKVPCEICDRMIASHFMNKHLKTHQKDTVPGALSD